MITQENLNTFRDKVKAVAAEMGLEARDLNITFSNESFSFRGKVYAGDAGYAEEFARVARMKGFPSEWYGMVFDGKDAQYKITGAASRGRKYPIKAMRLSDGAPFKFSISAVRAGNPLPVAYNQAQIEG